MKKIIASAICCASMTACSSTATLKTVELALESNYDDNANYYRIQTQRYSNKLGQGFLRSYNSECYLVSAAHIFENGHESAALNSDNQEIPLDLNENYQYPTDYSQIDTRIFNVSEVENKCPRHDKQWEELYLGQSLQLKYNSPDGDLTAIDLSVSKIPGIGKEDATFNVKVSSQKIKLQTGFSGSLLTENGVAIGMLIQILENGNGVVQPIASIDRKVIENIQPVLVKRTFCQRNKYLCIAGGILTGGLVAVLVRQGSDPGPEVALTVPVP